jgi:hypothetical protein
LNAKTGCVPLKGRLNRQGTKTFAGFWVILHDKQHINAVVRQSLYDYEIVVKRI